MPNLGPQVHVSCASKVNDSNEKLSDRGKRGSRFSGGQKAHPTPPVIAPPKRQHQTSKQPCDPRLAPLVRHHTIGEHLSVIRLTSHSVSAAFAYLEICSGSVTGEIPQIYDVINNSCNIRNKHILLPRALSRPVSDARAGSPARSPHKRYQVWGDQRYPKSGDWSQQSPICRRDYQRPCAFVAPSLS